MELTIVAILSSSVSIIIAKLFEFYHEAKKHERLIKEKVLDSKIDACNSAVKYYGTYFNYLYFTKTTVENLDNNEYTKLLLSKNDSFYTETLNKMRSDGDFHKILLFYDFYNEEDEKIAEKLRKASKNNYDFSNSNNKSNTEEGMKIRSELINAIDEAINYYKNKIKMVRSDIKNLMN